MQANMYNPVSTYRLQFNKHFTLHHAEELVGYFSLLGVKTIYASPIFKAVPGSLHGYDVVNPYEINPEIGDIKKLRSVIAKFKEKGIGWIQDIVPNHMAFHHSNPWLFDVLEKGSQSAFAHVFDITWTNDFFHGRLMVPFLDGELTTVIDRNELKIVYWQDRLCLRYGDQYYPLNSRTYGNLLTDSEQFNSMSVFSDQLNEIHHLTDVVQYGIRWHEILLQFASLMSDANARRHMEELLQVFNEDHDKLTKVCDDQHYRLCDWRETETQINYRRFFLVNGLLCLNMRSETVFARYHDTIKLLVQEGLFDGLRVDHIDGLYDPKQYLSWLRNMCGPDCYIVVEKILEYNERLDSRLPIQGTTGYEFLSYVNNILTRSSAENSFSSFYRSITDDKKSINVKIREKKAFILSRSMQGELDNLHNFFIAHNLVNDVEISPEMLREAIGEFLIQLPVYRYYGNSFPLEIEEQENVKHVLHACGVDKPHLLRALNVIEGAIFNPPASAHHAALEFYQRCMQFTGPLMAKGVEDTLMYTFNRFVGHNEVGDSPEFFGLSVADFHGAMLERQRVWPLSLNATSTHDTKRGEDVRMRLNVLPDLTNEWITGVKYWFNVNEQFKDNGSPDRNDEYFIYQTLIGIYPFHEESNLDERLTAYFTKALREAKRYSDWANPDESYESATIGFVQRIMQPGTDFMKSFISIQKKVSDFGIINSLSQTILKFICPGVPDTYQGTTAWELTLVDPDNRRLIDYPQHESLLKGILADATDADRLQTLWSSREDSRIKLWLTERMFAIRNKYSDLFYDGDYIPLEIEGRQEKHCLAFARRSMNVWVVVVIPLQLARIATIKDELIDVDWVNTSIVMPASAPREWQDVYTKNKGTHQGMIRVADIFKRVPVGVLLLEEKKRIREAGILLSLSSLPSSFGIGDMGSEARNFVDFLRNGRQQLWQLLPLNPTSAAASFSPYSAYSAMAGNVLYVSPEELVSMNLLSNEDLASFSVRNRGMVQFKEASKIKLALLSTAFENFQRRDNDDLKKLFLHFVEEESYWLNDFACFEFIKMSQSYAPWYSWPDELKNRDLPTLAKLQRENAESIQRIKWMQFIFFYQWKKLKSYSLKQGVRLFGDLPFYVSHDSADVWAHRDIFELDPAGNMSGIAGVPPDYFAVSGQLWNMPVFNWDKLKRQGYDWIIKRIKKNLELFDVLRLDHFRAFVDYWEVPQGESTAVKGQWRKGPGEDLFIALKKEFGELPFVAEDLGEITQDVDSLRERLGLPGMKVLQFAFGENIAETPYIPHNHEVNFVIYTGTHDNNTTRGWYRNDITADTRKRMETYCNKRISARTVSSELIRLAYSSVGRTVIIPLQDIMNLDERSRMNTPSGKNANWTWRLKELPDDEVEDQLAELTHLYNR